MGSRWGGMRWQGGRQGRKWGKRPEAMVGGQGRRQGGGPEVAGRAGTMGAGTGGGKWWRIWAEGDKGWGGKGQGSSCLVPHTPYPHHHFPHYQPSFPPPHYLHPYCLPHCCSSGGGRDDTFKITLQ